MSKATRILKVDASARKAGSVTRELSDQLVTSLLSTHSGASVIERDVAAGLPVVDEDWIGANFTDPAERTPEQRLKLALSDTLVNEVRSADVLVIGVPIYNFGVPASLKAWVDLIARARETFRYTENGPVGLLEGKKAFLIVASGGVKAGSEVDFATAFMKHILGFIGVKDVTVVAADQLMLDENKKSEAQSQIQDLAQAAA